MMTLNGECLMPAVCGMARTAHIRNEHKDFVLEHPRSEHPHRVLLLAG